MKLLYILGGIVMFALFYYTFLVTIGFDTFRGINIVLDDWYDNLSDISLATIDQLKKDGKDCKLLEKKGNGYPRLSVDGKVYFLRYKVASVRGFPVQVGQVGTLVGKKEEIVNNSVFSSNQ